ncbi:MAG TPA: hypothetical protein VFB53_01260 [Burkholderiales bacterium]|nr:hypothetical protein [Burkholderiales bacterium]
MRFTLAAEQDFLRAELFERETAAQTREFLAAAAAEALRLGLSKALISVHASRTIFRVEQYQFSAYVKALAERPSAMVALVAGSDEIHAAHQYVELLAQQHGANVRCFRHEAEAVQWLRSRI